jgi:signal transduction histidine kinase
MDETRTPGEAEAPAAAARPRPARLFLVLTGVGLLLLYALFEIAIPEWMSGAEGTRSVLHLAGGVAASTLAAALLGVWLLRLPPTLVVGTPEGGAAPPSDETRYRHHALGFIQMRWIAVFVTLTLVLVAVRIARLLPPSAEAPLLGTVAVLAGCNAAYVLLLRRSPGGRWLLPLQAVVDLVLLTVLLHFSGGIENPLSLVGLFHVILGGILLPRRGAYAVAVGASALFALLAWVEWSRVTTHYALLIFPRGTGDAAPQTFYVAGRVALQFTVYLLAAFFITALAERARADERQMADLAGRALAGRRLLEHSLATTGAGLCVIDGALRYRWMNDQWRAWFGEDPSGLSMLGGGDAGRHPARECLRSGASRVTEVVLPRPADAPPGAAPRMLQVTAAPLREGDRAEGQVVMLAQDVTEQKKTQERMIRDRRLAAIGELAGHVAHEVNNPMAIVIAKLRLLRSDRRPEMSEKVDEELAKCIDQGERVARIAQGLLSYCRPSSLARAVQDVRPLLRKALAMVEGRARERGVRVDEGPEAAVPPVRANADELSQVFLNLLLNAIDAMPEGGRLTVSARGEPAAAVVTVEDTGSGMTAEVRERIFEPFFTTKEVGRGTGLGLSICLGLVQSHGGSIEVESQPGQGSRFTVRLPAATPDSHPESPHG